MLDKIISSKSRLGILGLFFENKNKSFYAKQIVDLLKLDPANVHKELLHLEKNGFLNSNRKDNKKFFVLNVNSELYEALEILFKKNEEIKNRDKWFVLEDMPDYYPMVTANASNVLGGQEFLKQFGFKNKITKSLCIFNNGTCAVLFVKREFDDLGKEMVDRSIRDISWGEKYIAGIKKEEKILYSETEKLLTINLAKLTNKELYNLYNLYYDKYHRLHLYQWVHTLIDFGESFFSKFLVNYIQGKAKNYKYSAGEVFSTMTTPISNGRVGEEYISLLKLLKYINNSKLLRDYFYNTETRIIVNEISSKDNNLYKSLVKHVNNYGWIGYGTVGPMWSIDYYIDILRSLVKQKKDANKLINDYLLGKKKIIEKQKLFIRDLKIDKEHAKLFQFAQDLVYTKGSRKEAMFFALYAMENLFKEIGRRYYLSVNQIRYMYPFEFYDLLIKNKYDSDLLNERFKFGIHYSIGSYKEDIITVGKVAKKFVDSQNIIKQNTEDIKIFNGDCASPGRKTGIVKIVNVVSDMEKMKDGNILVSIATNPNLIPALKRASAIITDVGGITCHAAIVSREFGIPCIIGTKIATKVLKDGYLVDVDATHGKISIIKKAK